MFHNNFPTRSANVVPRAIYESDFIQDRWGFAGGLTSCPDGALGVDADVDLVAMDRRIGRNMLLNYGRVIRLLTSIDECFAIADDTRWLPYQHAGGLTSCTLYDGAIDHLDLDVANSHPVHNAAVKALIINSAWKIGADLGWANQQIISATPEVGKDVRRVNGELLALGGGQAHVAESLSHAFDMAVQLTGTDKAIAFDGSACPQPARDAS